MTSITAYVSDLARSRLISRLAARRGVATPFIQRLLRVAIDAFLIGISITAAVWGRDFLPVFSEVNDVYSVIRPLIWAIVPMWVVSLWTFGTYAPGHLRSGATEYKRVTTATLAMAAVLGITCYLTHFAVPRGFFVLLFVTGLPLLLLGRLLQRRTLNVIRRHGGFLSPVLVAGSLAHVEVIAKVLRRESWLGYDIAGALVPGDLSETPSGIPVLGSTCEAVRVIQAADVDAVIFAEGSFECSNDFRRMAWELEDNDTQMIVVPTLTDISAQRIDVRPVAGLPLVHVERPQALAACRWVKRLFDIVGSGLLLTLSAPVFALVALAIKLEDGGPVLFRQVRAGRKNVPFQCLKFRSMCLDAEAKLAALMSQNEGAGVLFKMTNDPRITRIGRFIRRFSLDELPQFWNVFRGEMSLVGPRPALPSEVAQYHPDVMRRLDVRPGLTGLWQVSGRSNLSWEDTVRLDLYYVDNWSMIQDLTILARTANAVLASRGAY